MDITHLCSTLLCTVAEGIHHNSGYSGFFLLALAPSIQLLPSFSRLAFYLFRLAQFFLFMMYCLLQGFETGLFLYLILFVIATIQAYTFRAEFCNRIQQIEQGTVMAYDQQCMTGIADVLIQ
ncbi:hypothetical protein D3C86_1088940 [compost metagenome]